MHEHFHLLNLHTGTQADSRNVFKTGLLAGTVALVFALQNIQTAHAESAEQNGTNGMDMSRSSLLQDTQHILSEFISEWRTQDMLNEATAQGNLSRVKTLSWCESLDFAEALTIAKTKKYPELIDILEQLLCKRASKQEKYKKIVAEIILRKLLEQNTSVKGLKKFLKEYPDLDLSTVLNKAIKYNNASGAHYLLAQGA